MSKVMGGRWRDWQRMEGVARETEGRRKTVAGEVSIGGGNDGGEGAIGTGNYFLQLMLDLILIFDPC